VDFGFCEDGFTILRTDREEHNLGQIAGVSQRHMRRTFPIALGERHAVAAISQRGVDSATPSIVMISGVAAIYQTGADSTTPSIVMISGGRHAVAAISQTGADSAAPSILICVIGHFTESFSTD
jgi:hypothetical protein